MSSPVAINRSVSPAESTSSVSLSVSSTSSAHAAHNHVYTRDELLVLAMSPLSQGSAPPSIAAFPVIMRKTRRGLLEARQALDYERGASSKTPAPAPAPAPAQGHGTSPNATYRPSSPQTNLPLELPPPVWKVDVYVPPARRMEQEQLRVRPGRDARPSRTWRRPAQARVVQAQRW